MLHIVEDILEAERNAERIVKSARDEVERIRAQADREATELLAKTREETRQRTRQETEEARRSAADRIKRLLEAEEIKADAFPDEHSSEIARIVDDVVDLVISIDRQLK